MICETSTLGDPQSIARSPTSTPVETPISMETGQPLIQNIIDISDENDGHNPPERIPYHTEPLIVIRNLLLNSPRNHSIHIHWDLFSSSSAIDPDNDNSPPYHQRIVEDQDVRNNRSGSQARLEQSRSAPGNHIFFARMFSSQFPEGHQLDPQFVEVYQLEDELGSGGYGFVMTARERENGAEVAVKFIIKEKVPEQSWVHDPSFGKLPMEVILLSYVNHENIVQELHGAPWKKSEGMSLRRPLSANGSTSSVPLSTPSLSPSVSEISLITPEPKTPPHLYPPLPITAPETSQNYETDLFEDMRVTPCPSVSKSGSRPEFFRRPSYDLFECIEQSEAKRLSEEQARYVFAQVVDAVQYLHSLGICHRDIKDENLVIDRSLKIKLIDFGSAIIVDPTKPPPYYDLFYGTAAYASSEILMKKKYQAAPAEVWTLGVLLSYLLAGISPFPTIRDAVDGKIFLSTALGLRPSENAMDLMKKCLDPNPETRATIEEIKGHQWLRARQKAPST